MSTRAVITFKRGNECFHVYQHCDGYPSGVAENLRSAIAYAWPLPRFEACEFAAAFVAGAKNGGNIYLSKGPRYHGDLSYRYVVRCVDGELRIDAFAIGDDGKDAQCRKHLTIDQLAMVQI